MVGLLIALPHTQLYRRLKGEGRILAETRGNNTHDFELNFIPQMPQSTLIRGYKWLLSQVYSPRQYFQRSLTLIKRFASGKREKLAAAGVRATGDVTADRIPRTIRLRDILALLRSLFRQGFSSYGYHYLRYLIQVLAMDISLFPRAMTLAVRGHHFIRITREIMRADAFKVMIQETLGILRREIDFLTGVHGRIHREDLEARIRPILLQVRRTYRGLGRAVQMIVGDAFADFEHRCQGLLQRIRVSYS
jgi:hypothetical protein